MTDGDRADGCVIFGDAEGGAELSSAFRWDTEETGPESFVDGNLQDQQRGHSGINVPVGHGPTFFVLIRPALIRFGVAFQIRGL